MAVSGVRAGVPIWHIRVNAELALSEEANTLAEVVPHEVAHLLVHHYFGESPKPHGIEWQRVMRSLGKEPSCAHSMEATPARVEPCAYLYRCRCKDHNLTARRHNRAAAGEARYACKDCAVALVFICGPRSTTAPVLMPASTKPLGSRRLPQASRAPAPPRSPASTVRPHQTNLPREPLLAAPANIERTAEPPSAAGATAPTEKQLAFARSLALRSSVAIPVQALRDRRSLSNWISKLSLLPR
jgi:SprT protein